MGDRTEVLEGRAAIGYDHGYDAQKFYLGLARPKYVERFVEGCTPEGLWIPRVDSSRPGDDPLQ